MKEQIERETKVETQGNGEPTFHVEESPNPLQAPMLASWLAYLYQPILPYLKDIKIQRVGTRDHNPADILLPEGYVAEVVATDLNAPVHCAFDNEGYCYVVESGHKIDVPPRILKVNMQSGQYDAIFTLPEEKWHKTGAMTGACWHEGALYVMNTDTLFRLDGNGNMEEIVTGLPGIGDHQANPPVVGPDEKIYFGQGCVTNMGVVGADNAAFEWLPKHPGFHDIPARDITLVGRNYEYQNVLGDISETVLTGAYSPFGVPTQAGQIIRGEVKCSGSILRCNLDGSNLEVVAWGLRNPYGLAFHPDNRLFATEHGSDERGRRYIVGDLDDFYEIQEGAWYGWPDFASGIRLDDPFWGDAGQGREPVLAEHPDPNPPKPFVSFPTHVAANGFDFCRNASFGFEGDAFVANFGDLAPITTLRDALRPAGFNVVRVDMDKRQVVDFAVNKFAGPASKLPHEGFERPSHCCFGPDEALYVVDYGIIKIAPERGGIRMPLGTGTLWRIRRSGGPHGERPPKPITLPLYGLQYAAIAGSLVGLVALGGWGLRRLLRKRK
jgi:glucose/arabinose dehydrogenase